MVPEAYIAILVGAPLGGLGLFLLLDEFRLRRIRAAGRSDSLFRCTDCGLVYTDDPKMERSRCPQCGKTNDVITF